MEETGVFTVFGIAIPPTVTTTWAIILVLTVLSWLATRNMKDVPGPLQNIAEIVVTKLLNFFSGQLGEKTARRHFPIFATFFIFIIVSNYSGLLPGAGHITGFAVPTASLSAAAALGIMAFVTTNTVGARELGTKNYLKTFLKPFALFLPLNLIEQVVHPFSLTLRLYGNLFGEESVVENLYEIFPIGLPIIMNVLSLIFCYMQALIFTMLLSIYVSEAIGEEH